jgi:hypothetical protein
VLVRVVLCVLAVGIAIGRAVSSLIGAAAGAKVAVVLPSRRGLVVWVELAASAAAASRDDLERLLLPLPSVVLVLQVLLVLLSLLLLLRTHTTAPHSVHTLGNAGSGITNIYNE